MSEIILTGRKTKTILRNDTKCLRVAFCVSSRKVNLVCFSIFFFRVRVLLFDIRAESNYPASFNSRPINIGVSNNDCKNAILTFKLRPNIKFSVLYYYFNSRVKINVKTLFFDIRLQNFDIWSETKYQVIPNIKFCMSKCNNEIDRSQKIKF